MAQRRFRARIFGAEIILPGSLFPIAREMYGRKAYFGLPSLRIRPGDSVVDLGANIGAFTLLAAKLGARVLAVEAQAGFIPLLRELVKQNGCEEKVFVEQALVGGHGMLDEPGVLDVASHHSPDRPPRHFRMAELLDRHSLDRIEFLKIDIEGSEFDLLTRDNDWLRRVQKITMEVHTLFGNPAILVATLAKFGFRSALFSADARPVERISGEGGYLCAVRESQLPRIAVPGRGQEGYKNCSF
jgi:FkbM family methyltransferase